MMTGAPDNALPPWVPEAVRLYLAHTEQGLSLRALARRSGRNASTVLRQVRRFEGRRDDPLVDEALAVLARGQAFGADALQIDKDEAMTAMPRHSAATIDEPTLAREGRRILRRMTEPGAILAVAPDLDRAAVLREMPDGRNLRTAVLDRALAQAFALKEWIVCQRAGRVTTYAITAVGRAALRRMIEEDEARTAGFAEAPTVFAGQHRLWGERTIVDAEDGAAGPRRLRVNLAESPVTILGRRRDKGGKPFLSPDLVAAAERLRQDFELAQMGPRVAQNWDRFLTAGVDRSGASAPTGPAEGPRSARDRVAAALRDLGPGLGDMALRCCCYLEGLETAERRLGWSARSGKIVLRIALIRLRRHYDENYGGGEPMIG